MADAYGFPFRRESGFPHRVTGGNALPILEDQLFEAVAGGVDATALPTVGAVTIAGLAPALAIGASTAPLVGTVAIGGLAPTASISLAAVPSVGAASIAGLAPTISVGSSITVAPASFNF